MTSKTLPTPALSKNSLALNGADIATLLAPIHNAFAGNTGVTLYICIQHNNGQQWRMLALALQKVEFIMITQTTNYTAPVLLDDRTGINPAELIAHSDTKKGATAHKNVRLQTYLVDELMPALTEEMPNVSKVSYFVRAT